MNAKACRKIRQIIGTDETTQYLHINKKQKVDKKTGQRWVSATHIAVGKRGLYLAAKALYGNFSHTKKHEFWATLKQRLVEIRQ